MVFALSAQTEQGRMLIGANTSLAISSSSIMSYTIDGDEPDWFDADDYPTTTTTSFAVDYGYFVIDNLAVGVGLNYSATKIDYADGDDYDGSTTAYGIFSRYYIGGVAFVGAGYAMATNSEWDEDYYDDIDMSLNVLMAEAGASIFLSDKVAFTPKIQYSVTTEGMEYEDYLGDNVEEKQQTGNLVIGAGFTIHL